MIGTQWFTGATLVGSATTCSFGRASGVPDAQLALVPAQGRKASAKGEPPGSRVTIVWMPTFHSWSARRRAWVDFPDPSPPSKVMNLPTAMSPPLEAKPRARA